MSSTVLRARAADVVDDDVERHRTARRAAATTAAAPSGVGHVGDDPGSPRPAGGRRCAASSVVPAAGAEDDVRPLLGEARRDAAADAAARAGDDRDLAGEPEIHGASLLSCQRHASCSCVTARPTGTASDGGRVMPIRHSNETGRRQAAELAEQLAGDRVAAVYSSDSPTRERDGAGRRRRAGPPGRRGRRACGRSTSGRGRGSRAPRCRSDTPTASRAGSTGRSGTTARRGSS